MMKKTAIALALVSITSSASANVIAFDWVGAFALTVPSGSIVTNSDSVGGPGVNDDAFGVRSTVAGTMVFDFDTALGTATLDPFTFSGTIWSAEMTLTAIGDGMGGTGPLMLASMMFNFGSSLDVPAYAVWDASGLFGAYMGGLSIGDVVNGGYGWAPSSLDAAVAASPYATYVPGLCDGGTSDVGGAGCSIAMTTWNVNQDASGNLITDGFPLVDDGFTGMPMATAPLNPHAVNIDITSMMVLPVVPPVPVPAAIWLFGSGLLAMIGVMRRKPNS